MSLSQAMNWDVRTTGSDSNGGAFLDGGTGTDYSQQNSPQITYTDLVIQASNFNLKSAANPFTSAHIGNVINITSGTGFTTGRYQVLNVIAGNEAQMDRALGTAASTGGNGVLGGAMATIGAAATAASVYNEIHVKAATYTLTAAISLTGSKDLTFHGYGTSHLDRGTKPLVTTSTNSTILFSTSGSYGHYFAWANFSFSNTATTRAVGINLNQGGIWAVDCIFDGFTIGIDGQGEGQQIYRCEFKNCTTYGLFFNPGDNYLKVSMLSCCYIHNNAVGMRVQNTGSGLVLQNCIIASNTSQGIDFASTQYNNVHLYSNTIAGNGTDGIAFASGAVRWFSIINNIFYGNGGYGIRHSFSAVVGGRYNPLLFLSNAYGSNTSGNSSEAAFGTGLSAVTLTVSPFTASGSGDYSLNSTAGGGAACKASGYATFPGGLSTGIPDIGAVQTSGAGSTGGLITNTSMSGGTN
jgi:hypothetical protein